MLSKSQARNFFIGFTVLFSGTFLALTVDSLRQVPARSHEEAITPAVAAGKAIWESNNCMGCHTIFGEGAYYAPELTKVVERRGEPWIRRFLKDPAAMYPGRRKMVNYHFDDAQIDSLVAFFTWVGNVDTNGFPAQPDLILPGAAQAATPDPSGALASAPAIVKELCVSCHRVGGTGGNVGPALDGVASRRTPADLDAWLKDPAAVKPGTAMPNLQLDDSTRAALVAWLSTQH